MIQFPLASDRVSLGVTQTGGHLSDVTFTLPDGRQVRPMHVAPWADEDLPDDTPAILKVLRGDFFCAPFGLSDLIEPATPVHGPAANGTWRLLDSSATALDAELAGGVMGATLTKHVEVRQGEAVVYQRHSFSGGNGRLPIGHHAMLYARSPLQLAFSPWKKALTPAEPVETAPHGRDLLAAGQSMVDLKAARRVDGSPVDLTVYPTPDGTEAIWMLVSDPTRSFSWTAATAAEEGWVWFGLKNPRVLPQTLIWCSNGGRDYAPWNGRHRRVIGLEEICGYFHLSHGGSIGDNPVATAGSPTAIELGPGRSREISYIFGLAETPAGFGAVADIRSVPGGIELVDAEGRKAFAACDVTFLGADG
jgi:hypothetical protein